MVNIKFEGITPSLIIEASRPQSGIDYYNIRPIEVVKTKYVAGQTLILKGKKSDYKSLVAFWLSIQVWYGVEGGEDFYETLIIDELWSYSEWHAYPHRVGICQVANSTQKQKYDKRISFFFNMNSEYGYLIMDPTWDNEKVLFLDDTYYYCYYFWTGE
jgi:hypothetical protein